MRLFHELRHFRQGSRSRNLPQRKSPRNPLIRFDSSLKRLPAILLLSGASQQLTASQKQRRWTSLLWRRAKIILAKGHGGSLNRQLFTQRQARANKRLCARPLHQHNRSPLRRRSLASAYTDPSSALACGGLTQACRIWLETPSHLTRASFEANLRTKAHAHMLRHVAASNWRGRRRHAGAVGVRRAPQFREHDALHGAGAGPR